MSYQSPTPLSALTSPSKISFLPQNLISFTQFLLAFILIFLIGWSSLNWQTLLHLSIPLIPANGEVVPSDKTNYIDKMLPTLQYRIFLTFRSLINVVYQMAFKSASLGQLDLPLIYDSSLRPKILDFVQCFDMMTFIGICWFTFFNPFLKSLINSLI